MVAELCIGTHHENIILGVTNLGSGQLFLGHDWLVKHDPTIKWSENKLSLDDCHCSLCQVTIDDLNDDADADESEKLEPGDRILCIDPTEALHV